MKRLTVYLSPLASFTLDMLLEYLEHEWGTKSKNSFLDKFIHTIDQLRSNLKSFPVSRVKKGIRSCVVTSHTSMYYRTEADSVEIITISDNRQDHEKVWNEINNYFQEG